MVSGKMKWVLMYVCICVSLFYETNGKKCPQTCGNEHEPLCGSDGNTYNNPCHLDLNACDQGKRIFMVHKGRCNPCNTHECVTPPNSRCVVNANGLPECVCSFICYPFKREVCGSDGQTYKNKCEMKKSSCTENVLIRLANAGPCGGRGACSRIKCPSTSICRVVRGRAKCVRRLKCKLLCPRVYRPICGTNGKTYSNQCVLDRFVCSKNADVVVSYKGRCRVPKGACRRKECPKGMYCELRTRQARCVRACRRFCPRVYHPVCADDGRTYENNCEREREACETNTKINFVLSGRCKDSKFGCKEISCGPHSVCRNIFGTPKCYKKKCKRWCARIYRPVCASDGKTYPNECEVEMQSCRRRKIVRKIRNGRCVRNAGCQLTTCLRSRKPYSFCKVVKEEPTCVCKDKCPDQKQPVCGSDKKTYRSKCHMEILSCKTELKITVAHNGECGKNCETKDCSSLPYSICRNQEKDTVCLCPSNCNNDRNIVCGSNGVTYTNLCLMKRYSCYDKKLVTVKHMGNCSNAQTSQTGPETCVQKNCSNVPYSSCKMLNNQSRCTCPESCTATFKPVCGSDGKTYVNSCIMEKASCENKTMVAIKYNGRCKDIPNPTAKDTNTCAEEKCSNLPYSTCKNIGREINCICAQACTNIIKPVCGSDNETYPNVCTMERVSCENKTLITIKANGKCVEVLRSSKRVEEESCANCSSVPYSHCKVDDGQTMCTCSKSCTKVLKPVCGSDGQTYPNACILEKISCENKTLITIKANRKCTGPESCDQKHCSSMPYSTCVIVNGRPTCHCAQSCKKILKLVCGSDGKTYPNSCSMEKASCESGALITSLANGKCKENYTHAAKEQETCAQKTCSRFPYSTCKMIKSHPICMCPTSCNKTKKPVCGSDGKTYPNVCAMKEASCINKLLIVVKPIGDCKENQSVTKLTNGSETCDRKNCSGRPYINCKMVGNQAKCTCSTYCSKILKPVCGSDGKTYANVCIMERTSCEMNKRITIKAHGKCEAHKTDSKDSVTCIEKNCSSRPYSICKIVDGQPQCTCQTSCTEIFKPVCGSDDITYPNFCILEKTSCENKTKINIKSNGRCVDAPALNSKERKTCAEKNCSSLPYSICKVVDEQPRCKCPIFCSMVIKPVCGSDSKTYNNSCIMKKLSCENKLLVTIAANRSCIEASSPPTEKKDSCARRNCSSLPYSKCSMVNSEPTCSCPNNCTDISKPVCGSDNETYLNICMMQKASCENKAIVTIKSNATCQEHQSFQTPETCAYLNCSYLPYSTCKMVKQKAICVCHSSCTKGLEPVCGSDNITYMNLCIMEKLSCENKTFITLKRNGSCKGGHYQAQKETVTCAKKNCSTLPYAKCIMVKNEPTCTCPSSCSKKKQAICGSDGKNYLNKCILEQLSCQNKAKVTVDHPGKCKDKKATCAEKNCTSLPYSNCKMMNNKPICRCPTSCNKEIKPVCGSDGKMYRNECAMRKLSCESGLLISVKTTEKCKASSNRTNERRTCAEKNCSSLPYSACTMVNDLPICMCPTSCTGIFKPICGSDGRTYSNVCTMQQQSCYNQTMITIKKNGKCKDSSVSVVNQETCEEKNCSSLRPYSTCTIVHGRPTCICPMFCNKVHKPVCGSDNKTHLNVCILRKIACDSQKMIAIKSNRKCKEDRCKLCYTRPYARCAVAKNQTVPLCTCPTICSRTFQPVCGSDGNTYFNPCEMMKKACLKNFKITAEKKGFCENLCLRKDCTVELPYSSCKVIGNKPRCLCQPFCGGLHRPVCGSDNVTYTNDCMMRKASCETASWVSVKHEGACVDTKAYAQPKQTPCAQKNCSGTPYSFCKMIENKPMCKCPERCNTTLKPICGSDGVTYLNLCLLKVTSCKQGKVVTVKSEGHCQDECSKVNCKFYSKCHIKRKKPICVCPRRLFCSNIRHPVCGSDGNVYPNECIMQSVSCAKRKLIRSIADTRKCSGKLCRPWSPCSFPPYSRCLSFRGQFSCRCPRFCRTTHQPACGSDKRIYGNRCTLQKYACLSRQSIRQVHIRQCAPLNTCYKVVCQRRQRCKMISNKPRCVSRFCVRRCPLKVRLVCGSDNKTYRNECELRRKACMENVRILRARFGACR